MISHTHKFIFIEVNKTGTTTINRSLHKYGEPRKGKTRHLSISQILHNDSQISNYFRFTFVRNPWDRCVSLFNYRVQKRSLYKDLCFNEFIQSLKENTFKEWYKNNYNNLKSGPVSCPQVFFLYNENEEIKMDFIGKFENLQEDFNIVCDKIGIPKQQLPHKNATKHKHYTEYYDDETKQIVAEKYAKDIEYFGYEFGE